MCTTEYLICIDEDKATDRDRKQYDTCVDSTVCSPGQSCIGLRCVDDTEAPTEVPTGGASDTTPVDSAAAGAGG